MGRQARKRQKSGRAGDGVSLFDELGIGGFSRAFHSHIEDLAYEMLKDREYQEWMKAWLERFFQIGLKKLRAKKIA